jgi:hypothetical protein
MDSKDIRTYVHYSERFSPWNIVSRFVHESSKHLIFHSLIHSYFCEFKDAVSRGAR